MESPAGGASSCHRGGQTGAGDMAGSGSHNERVSLRCQAWPPLASSSALEGKALEDLAQNTHGSLAISLTGTSPVLSLG